jgi:hypothetical protein
LSEINEISDPLQREAFGPPLPNGYAELDPAAVRIREDIDINGAAFTRAGTTKSTSRILEG